MGPAQPLVSIRIGHLSAGLKWTGREADHSPQSSAEVNDRANTSAPPVCLHGVNQIAPPPFLKPHGLHNIMVMYLWFERDRMCS
jgi:hypothetical protein